MASRADHIRFNKCYFGMPEVIPTYLRETFSIARQGKKTTINPDRLCKLSRLCDGILPLVGSLVAFVALSIAIASAFAFFFNVSF